MNHTAIENDQMAERATITIHTDPETRERLARLASSTRRSKSFLGNEAIQQYLEAEEEFVAAVQEGIADADAGRMYTSEEVQFAIKKAVLSGASHQS